jgi:hypothetical protein
VGARPTQRHDIWGQFIAERTTGYRRYFFIRVTASCASRNVIERCYRRLKGFRRHALQHAPQKLHFHRVSCRLRDLLDVSQLRLDPLGPREPLLHSSLPPRGFDSAEDARPAARTAPVDGLAYESLGVHRPQQYHDPVWLSPGGHRTLKFAKSATGPAGNERGPFLFGLSGFSGGPPMPTQEKPTEQSSVRESKPYRFWSSSSIGGCG